MSPPAVPGPRRSAAVRRHPSTAVTRARTPFVVSVAAMEDRGNRLVVSLFFGDHDSNVTVADRHRVLLHLEAERVLGLKHVAATAEQMDEVIRTALDSVGADEDAVDEVLVAKW